MSHITTVAEPLPEECTCSTRADLPPALHATGCPIGADLDDEARVPTAADDDGARWARVQALEDQARAGLLAPRPKPSGYRPQGAGGPGRRPKGAPPA